MAGAPKEPGGCEKHLFLAYSVTPSCARYGEVLSEGSPAAGCAPSRWGRSPSLGGVRPYWIFSVRRFCVIDVTEPTGGMVYWEFAVVFPSFHGGGGQNSRQIDLRPPFLKLVFVRSGDRGRM